VNDWQTAQQIKSVLIARTWEGSGQVVFPSNSVHVTNGFQQTAAANFRFPIALVGIGNGAADEQIPGHVKQAITVVIAVWNEGDMIGETSIIGANRQGTNRSEGRGILEVKEEVLAACRQMQDALGVRMSLRATTTDTPAADQSGGMTTWMGVEFEADCTDARYYHPPQDLVATGGVGQVTLTWALPPLRWDLRRVRLRRAAGSTPPASISAGSEVALAADLSTSKVDVVAGGIYSYTLFACYDEVNSPPSADSRFSSVEAGSFRSGVIVG
jgi:hypothetical protein